MNTLYIHGLDSYPVPEKMEAIRRSGLDPAALHINYRNTPDAYDMLKDEAVKEEAKFIIGSSMGGYLGFWLAEDLGLPCLLFNPAMGSVSTGLLTVPEITEMKCPARYVVLGAYDESVDPVRNLEFMRKHNRNDMIQRVVTCEWLGHKIDFFTFKEMVMWAVFNLKNDTKLNM